MSVLIRRTEISEGIKLDYNPTLESILMIERTIEKYSGEYTTCQLWKKLPRKISYQAYKIVISYLMESNKITMDCKKKLVWIWNPEMIDSLNKQGLIVYE